MELQSIPQFEIHCSENETGISNRKTQLLLHTGKSFLTLDKSNQNQLPIDLELIDWNQSETSKCNLILI